MKRVLWAKSRPSGARLTPPTVAEHCRAVHAAAQTIWTCVESKLGEAVAADVADLRQTLRPLFLATALLHDVGKANSSFQEMVQDIPRSWKRQPVRHEVLSAVLATSPRFWRGWLQPALGEQAFWSVVWAIAGHHLAVSDADPENPIYRTGDVPSHVTVYVDDEQVRGLLEAVRSALSSAGRYVTHPPEIRTQQFSTLEDEEDSLAPLVRDLCCEASSAWEKLRQDPDFVRNLAILKALLIAADVAGSALPADGKPIKSSVQQMLAIRLTPEDLRGVIDDNLGVKPPRPFQEQVADSTASATIVMAGCGNGKTTAAYMWAQRHAVGRKLIFTYPTTGTASAGFKDYLSVQRHLERALIHGRAWVDLQSMPDSPDDSAVESTQRLESLQAWQQHVIACTVDTVLGLLQNQRRPLFSFPAILLGAIVFDEVHSYDSSLFGSLLRFLTLFRGVPALLMSATLPPPRLDALRRVLRDRLVCGPGSLGTWEPIRGDERLERIYRYRLHHLSTVDDCWREVGTALSQGKKVLWVCNTVGDAIGVYRNVERRLLPPHERLVYHSRFRYRHRVQRQNEVVEELAFHAAGGRGAVRAHPRPALIISTQVCEMSLDISADVLVTSLCPLPALVQRLGRLNRYARNDDPWPCFVAPFEIGPPYDEEEAVEQMHIAEQAVRDLDGQPCNQEMLSARIASSQAGEAWTEELYSAWLDGGWQSESLPLRDSDRSITLIREEDLPDIVRELGPEDRLTWTARKLVPWTIPMVMPKSDFVFQRRVGGYPLARAGAVTYDPMEGATWSKQSTA